MQAAGVRVAPYINGRIFDMGTQSWYISESRFLNLNVSCNTERALLTRQQET